MDIYQTPLYLVIILIRSHAYLDRKGMYIYTSTVNSGGVRGNVCMN